MADSGDAAADRLVRLDAGGGIATITLDSPHNANALSTRLLTQLRAAFDDAIADPGVRVLILTGAGRVFCAGADLKEARVNPTGATGLMAGIMLRLWESPKPVICRLNGAARAGGIGLVAACDIAIAAEQATFAFSEVRIGVVPAVISVPCLRRMPSRAAAEYFLTGEVFPALRAVELGLLTRAVAAEDLDTETDRYARLLLRGAPGAVAGTKGLLRNVLTDSFADGLAKMAELSGTYFGSAEAREGMAAFAEKRDPSWVAGPARSTDMPRSADKPQPAVLRIANCSGFYGDRLSAAREMVQGGPIDVLTGDWLAELTMLLLGKAMLSGRPGYARTFLTQLEQVLPACLERGIKIVSNAGGLDPAGCAAAVSQLASRLGLNPVVAHVTGDDLLPRLPGLLADGHELANSDTGERLADLGVTPLTAHAYLGGLPIAKALAAGADVVVTGRVTDAALVVGPGMWHFGWGGDDLDALAGAVAAGHIIECGCQATGGNYSFFGEVPDLAHAGFPLAELAADGSAVITKHPGTGGQVSVGTVTAQLLYEIGSPRYLNPEVTARFDAIELSQAGPDRVLVRGTRGEPQPADLKVALNYAGGYRNSMVLVLEGGDVAAKAALAEQAIWARVDGGRDSFETVDVDLAGTDPALLRISVLDPDRARVGRAFSAAVVETALASYPGFYALTPPADASAYGVFWPTTIPAGLVTTQVVIDGEPVWTGPARAEPAQAGQAAAGPSSAAREQLGTPDVVSTAAGDPSRGPLGPAAPASAGPCVRRPLGTIAGARSGDKGGNANLGVWVRGQAEFRWLEQYLTAERLAELVPSVAGLRVERHSLPNLLAVNFVIAGLLGRGVAASTRLDPQAKALGEELRAALAEIPQELLSGASPHPRRGETADQEQA